MKKINLLIVLSVFLVILMPVKAQETIHSFAEGLSVPLKGKYGRDAIVQDELLYQLMKNTLTKPVSGGLFWIDPDNQQDSLIWETIKADDKGWFQGRNLRGGYLYLQYESPSAKDLILKIDGHAEVWINGEPRGGDVYAYGWVELPVRIKRGVNTFVVKGSRGRVSASLVKAESNQYLTELDILLPDLIQNSDLERFGAVRIINASPKTLEGFSLESSINGTKKSTLKVAIIGPYTSRKVPFKVGLPENSGGSAEVSLQIRLLDPQGKVVNELDAGSLKVLKASEKHKETFLSDIDGSVQYYSVVPPIGGFRDSLALVMTLHGASVEAVSQANAYGAKDWGTIVAPTNRRPYGFDWEDWGRLDALEVYELALERYQPDPAKRYLTGHSMGGHGTWHVGVTFPGEWAAIAPSAGWYSFWSYAGKESEQDNPMAAIFEQASNGSNTLALSQNYTNHGIYILHGDQDDNVPVDQARFMRKHLSDFHPDYAYYERPGAGHWWGNECVDWPPLFRFFEDHQRMVVDQLKSFTFKTASPGISASFRHITIMTQIDPRKLAEIDYAFDPAAKRITLGSKNVHALQINLSEFAKNQPYDLTIDEEEFKLMGGEKASILLIREEQGWQLADELDDQVKNPERSGLFKDAFRNRFVYVYGTAGSRAENSWALNKARFDAETFWYRGNGSVDVVSDEEYLSGGFEGRNVILVGHSDMNKAWNQLISNCPIQISRDRIQMGERTLAGNDLGAYFIYPMDHSPTLSVGVIAGTGPEGLWSVYPNRYFVSGSGFPDFMIFSAEMYKLGLEAVKAAGFFDSSWQLNPDYLEEK